MLNKLIRWWNTFDWRKVGDASGAVELTPLSQYSLYSADQDVRSSQSGLGTGGNVSTPLIAAPAQEPTRLDSFEPSDGWRPAQEPWADCVQFPADKCRNPTRCAREGCMAKDGWHMANGVADLAMKHRDAAEARARELERLLNECRDMSVNWPGIAHSIDLERRIDAALDRAAPTRGDKDAD